ncbi:hypothetical protein TcasGA2_TC005015 [Tribolium castaneum]|uniref:Sushi domain-containing protein n=1 Tax=Tribolium castaneum TaxID=7070 RepID=D7EJL7_TRICA|nr:hypothetical protein TcasGA2_TC005015 [Tribolium castaneum]
MQDRLSLNDLNESLKAFIEKYLFPNLGKLVLLTLTPPHSNAAAKRTFSIVSDNSFDNVFCSSILTDRINAICEIPFGPNKGVISCDVPLPPGTVVNYECKPYYVPANNVRKQNQQMVCQPDGTWNREMLRCIPGCLTCWPKAFPMERIDANTVAQTFFSGWIARFGTPQRITIDQSIQFESDLFRSLNSICGTTKFLTPSSSKPDDPECIHQIRHQVENLKPPAASRHGTKHIFTFKEFETCNHVSFEMTLVSHHFSQYIMVLIK